MIITPYSIVTSILWFSAACLIGCMILPKISRGGLVLIAVIFGLGFIRLCVPLDFFKSTIVRSYFIYGFLQKVVQKPVLYGFTLGQCLLLLWATGSLIRLMWLVSKLMQQFKFRSNSHILENGDGFVTLARQIGKELGYYGDVRIAVSPNATTAYQAGLLCPYILLPWNIKDFSVVDIRNILYHELYHFLGCDLWIMLGIQAVTCILWWNPVMYLLCHSVEQLLELRCDQRVCGHLEESGQLNYLQTLINLAQNSSPEHTNIILGYTGSSEANIMQRFQMMTQAKTTSRERIKFFAGLAVCVLLFIASYSFILQPGAAPPTGDIDGDDVETFSIATFIIRSPDGDLTLYLEGRAAYSLSELDLQKEPYCNYRIFDESE